MKLKQLKILTSIILVIGIIFLTSFFIGNFENDSSSFQYNEDFEILLIDKNYEKKSIPDIYYIILDEYAGLESLENNLEFDNSKFYSQLSDRNFFIPSKSYSNYPYTLFSIPSSLNMQYLNFFSKNIENESEESGTIKETLDNNLVMRNLKSNGYHIVSFFAGNEAIGSENLIDEKICGQNFYINNYLGSLFPSKLLEEKRTGILCTFEKISEISEKTSKPIFVFAHMSIPHKPFVFDENGNPIDQDLQDYSQKELYLEQLKFANEMTIITIDKILSNSERASIIIIQSDHGERTEVNWSEPTEAMILQGLNNLNAYYVPEGNETNLYDGISPVNTFRVIFNDYFNSNFELLEDRYFWMVTDKEPYHFIDVTEIIEKNR